MKYFEKFISICRSVLAALADCIVPTLPIMIGAGMLRVLLILLSQFGILNETSSTYIVLDFVAAAGYYFMPVYAAVSSADVFRTNRFFAAFIGAMLISPVYIRLVSENAQLNVFGIPLALTDYSSQVLPSIIAVFIMAKIWNFLEEKLHTNIRAIFTPLLTILIMIPVAFGLIGPAGVFLSDQLVTLIMFLQKLGPLGNAIMCAIIPFITIMGLGGANLSAMLSLAAKGVDPILFFSNVLYNCILGFVTFAVYLHERRSETLAAAITSALAGSSEAAIFTVVMKDAKALFALCLGDFLAGLYAGISGVKSYAMASFGIFGIITTIGPDSSIISAAIAMAIGCFSGFIVSWLLHRKNG